MCVNAVKVETGIWNSLAIALLFGSPLTGLQSFPYFLFRDDAYYLAFSDILNAVREARFLDDFIIPPKNLALM